MYFFEKDTIPKEFSYPKDYVDFVKSGCELESPWWLLGKRPDFAMRCFKVLNEDLESEKVLIPFAKTDDGGDIACFDGDDEAGHPRICFYVGEESLKNINLSDRYSIASFSGFLSSISNL